MNVHRTWSNRAAAGWLIALVATVGFGWRSVASAQTVCSELAASDPAAPRAQRTHGLGAYQGLVENNGQWPADVLFFARQQGIELTVRTDALVIQPAAEIVEWDRDARPPREPVMRMPMGEQPLVLAFEYRGEPTSARATEAHDPLPTLHHFLTEPLGATDCRGFESVVLHEVAPGISLRVRIDDARFAYDVIAAPGSDLEGFALRMHGATDPVVDAKGVLLVGTSVGFVGQQIEAAWQSHLGTGQTEPLTARFALRSSMSGDSVIGFEANWWDRTRELVIDPTLLFLTYVGGSGTENPVDIAVDSAGNTYMACWTTAGAPTTVGSFQPMAGGGVDAWVGKLSASGSQLLFATFLGTVKTDRAAALDVAPDDAPVVVGDTWSPQFPTTPGSYQPSGATTTSTSNIFVTKLSPVGNSLLWSTFVGGPDYEHATAVTVLDDGDVVVAGDPDADLAPLPDAQVFDATFNAGDKMILKLSSDGTALEWLTYFRTARILCLAHDAQGEIVFGGNWYESDGPLPTTPGAFQATTPDPPTSFQADGFVARLSADAHELLACTHLSGTNSDTVWDVAVDAAGAIYAVSQVDSGDFPTTPSALMPAPQLNADGGITKLLPRCTALVWSTYIGAPINGGGGGFVERVAVDASGNCQAVGSTNEPGFPTTPDALQPNYIGPFPSTDAHYTKVDAFGESLVYSTWIGGSGQDGFSCVDLDGVGRPVMAILSSSPNLPTTPFAYDRTLAAGGSGDLAVLKLDLGLLPWRVLGFGLGGTYGETPNLAGRGALTPGSTTRLSLRGARPGGIAWMVVGFSTLQLPLLGGTLMPAPDFAVSFPTGALGKVDVTFPWPSLAPGTNVWFQSWSLDFGAPEFWAASNALLAIGQ